MTKEELKAKLEETHRLQKEETEKYREQSGIIGLDSPVSSKYAKIRKKLFEQYEKEKED